MEKYILGIDLGTTSVGFAGVVLGEKKELKELKEIKLKELKEIKFAGVHLFDAPVDRNGKTLASFRGEHRRARRIIARKSNRLKKLRRLFEKHFSAEAVASIDQSTDREKAKKQPKFGSFWIWELRAKKALNEKLKDSEFVRVLYHIAKNRGWKSNSIREATEEDKDKKVIKKAIESNKKGKKEEGTVTEFLYDSLKKKNIDNIRNREGYYKNSIGREEIKDEINKIFERQREKGNEKATKDLQEEYEKIVFYQRPMQSSINLVGYCLYEKECRRAPKKSITAELFDAWRALNNLRFYKDGQEQELTEAQKEKIINLRFKIKSVSYKKLRKELSLDKECRFKGLDYKESDSEKSPESKSSSSENKKIICFEGHRAFIESLFGNDKQAQEQAKKYLNDENNEDNKNNVKKLNNVEKLDSASEILSFQNDKGVVEKSLEEVGFKKSEIDKLIEKVSEFKGTHSFSLKALKKMLPYVNGENEEKNGENEEKGCYYSGTKPEKEVYPAFFREQKGDEDRITPFSLTKNSVVDHTLAEARKVINACIGEYGMPEKIIVELARDIGGSKKNKEKNKKVNEENRKKNDEVHNEREKHKDLSFKKCELWIEQGKCSIYSGRAIKPEDVEGCEVDHILPYSETFDDSRNNKVLCFKEENQKKGKRIPFEYMSDERESFRNRVLKSSLSQKKKDMLLISKDEYDERKSDFCTRALNDTRYITKRFENHIKKLKAKVETRNGQLTAKLRYNWGFEYNKKLIFNDKHHALDAIILACSTRSMVKQAVEDNKKGQSSKFKQSCEKFKEKVEKKLNEVFVSRSSVNKKTGALHEETIQSIRQKEGYKRIDRDEKQGDKLSIKPGEVLVKRISVDKLGKSDKLIVGDKESKALKHYLELKSKLKIFKEDENKKFSSDVKEKIIPILEEKKKITYKELRDELGIEKDFKFLNKEGEEIEDEESVFKTCEDVEKLEENKQNKKNKGDKSKIEKEIKGMLKVPLPRVGGIEIKKVHIESEDKTGVYVREGFAKNGSMERTDVFYNKEKKGGNDKGYYLRPVYLNDLQKGKEQIEAKPPLDWKGDELPEFCFSLRKNDFVKIKKEKDGCHLNQSSIEKIIHLLKDKTEVTYKEVRGVIREDKELRDRLCLEKSEFFKFKGLEVEDEDGSFFIKLEKPLKETFKCFKEFNSRVIACVLLKGTEEKKFKENLKPLLKPDSKIKDELKANGLFSLSSTDKAKSEEVNETKKKAIERARKELDKLRAEVKKLEIKKKFTDEISGYFVGTDVSKKAIKLRSPDGRCDFNIQKKEKNEFDVLRVLNLEKIEKYKVDYFGKETRVESKKEERGKYNGNKNCTDTKSSTD